MPTFQRFVPYPKKPGVGFEGGGSLADPSIPHFPYYGGVPNWGGLEGDVSARIKELLNPPDLFPDTSRMAAETAAARGIHGSPAGYSTGVRMTDAEKLRRIALGNELLTAGVGRDKNITPYQGSVLDLERQRLELEKEKQDLARILQEFEIKRRSEPTFRAGGGGGRGGKPTYGMPANDPFGGDIFGGMGGAAGWGTGGDPLSGLGGDPWDIMSDASNWYDTPPMDTGAYPGMDYSPYEIPQYGQPPSGLPPFDEGEWLA